MDDISLQNTGSSAVGGGGNAVFEQIARKIIEQQQTIIGSVAVERAQLVKQMQIDWSQHSVTISGDPKACIDKLVEQYKELFGEIAVETCKEAAARFSSQLTIEQLPNSLK